VTNSECRVPQRPRDSVDAVPGRIGSKLRTLLQEAERQLRLGIGL
jgi:hypothetical protein